MSKIYTEDHINFIADNVKNRSSENLTEVFNANFNTDFSVSQIIHLKKTNRLTSGIDAKFQKGRISHNKGKKGLSEGSSTSFKKGRVPHNYLPVGTEIINGDGYSVIKVADLNIWKYKQRIVWEKANGSIPKGFAVIFSDRNKQNFNLDNLVLISKAILIALNRKHWILEDSDLTKAAINITKVNHKIGELENSIKKG